MRILVVGAGEVGSSIAASLAESHEIVVIDIDPDRVDSLTYRYDVLALEGDGTSLESLEDAGVEKADILIASTDDDETNLATCGTVKTISDAFTIARVKKTAYLDTWQRNHGAFGVDFMVSTNLLSAQAIVNVIGLPTALDVDPFAGGRVQMAEFEVPTGSPVADQTVQQADRFESLTFAAVLRNGEVEIPTGQTVINEGDRVVVIGSPESVQGFAAAVAPEATSGDVQDVVIVGGSAIGFLTARLLEQRGFSPRLIESDPDRARQLAEDLPDTTVMQHDATDIDFLEREHVGDADLVIASLASDEQSLLVSLLARQLGAKRTVAVVDQGQYVDLFETVGIDVAVNPREVTAEEITRFTREQQAENVAIIEADLAEVLEFEVEDGSVLVGRPIREVVGDLPAGIVIGALTRNGELVTPRGDTVIEPGDHVVIFVRADRIAEVTAKL
ncbi:Trk system potassium transporter TrkA [Halobacteriaceae archaeon GCM10025711]